MPRRPKSRDLPPHEAKFCKRCHYHLVGLEEAGACPECGRRFDPYEPSTFLQRPPRRLESYLFGRTALLGAVTLIVTACIYMTFLPRPYVAWDGEIDWSVWEWFWKPYGVQHLMGPEGRIDVWWWAGHVQEVAAYSRDEKGKPSPRWRVAREDVNEWTVEVYEAGVSMDGVLRAFNSVRDDEQLFGVRLIGADRDGNEEPFAVSGPKEDILTAVIHAYGVRVEPFLLSADDEDVWVYDEQAERAILVSVEEARARGYEVEQTGVWNVPRHDWSR